jgi:PAS domain S-box-containing protein
MSANAPASSDEDPIGPRSDWTTSLVEATVALLSSPEAGIALERILDAAQALVPADAYGIWRRNGEEWTLVAARGLSSSFVERSTFRSAGDHVAALPFITPDISDDPRLHMRSGAYAPEGIRALAAFPLHFEDALLGTVTFYFRRPHHFTEEELYNAGLLAKMAAAALSAAQSFEQQKKLRAEAEWANKRAAFLAEAGSLISSSLHYETTLQAVASLMVPEMADWCAIDILDRDGQVRRLAVAHVDPGKVALAHEMRRRHPVDLDAATGLAKVLRTREAEFYPEVTAEMIERTVPDPDYRRILHELHLRSVMIVPLVARDRVIGAITLVGAESGRIFNEADLVFARSLAYRAAFAIDNARLFEDARNSERALHLALQAANAWSWEYSPAMGFLSRSRDVSDLYGNVPLTVDATLHQMFPEDRERVREMLHAALDQDSEQEAAVRVRSLDGSVRWLWVRGRRVQDTGGTIKVVGVAADITSRKRGEEAMQVAERMATLGRLAATVTHEINNPLEAVLQLLYLLRGEPLTKNGREYLATAENEVGRIAEIVRSTLGYARRSEVPRRLPVHEPLLDAIRLPAMKGRSRGVEVRVEHGDDCCVTAPPGELRQIFLNLTQNAIDATPAGGTVTVRVRDSRNWTNLKQTGVRVSISDNGTGIRPEDRPRIFAEPFFSTKGDQGTGLGLWVTRTLVQKNGGSIRFRSSVRPGRSGTCFSLFLPHRAPASAAPGGSPEQGKKNPRQRAAARDSRFRSRD